LRAAAIAQIRGPFPQPSSTNPITLKSTALPVSAERNPRLHAVRADERAPDPHYRHRFPPDHQLPFGGIAVDDAATFTDNSEGDSEPSRSLMDAGLLSPSPERLRANRHSRLQHEMAPRRNDCRSSRAPTGTAAWLAIWTSASVVLVVEYDANSRLDCSVTARPMPNVGRIAR
jgi:hypothetical protein